jgi:hypothetical protein
MFDDVAVLVVGAALLGLVLHLVRCLLADPAAWRRVAVLHASPCARLAEALFWTSHHLRGGVAGASPRRSLTAAARALGMGVSVAFVPLAGVAIFDTPAFAGHHGVALGLGAVVWSSIVEFGGLLSRIAPWRVAGRPEPSAIGLVAVLDVGVLLAAMAPLVSGDVLRSAVLGAALIAAADLAAVFWTLILAVEEDHPLKEG